MCKPDVRKESSENGKLRKLKENFTIALGLSLLFGLGWAFGLLASSDLPGAVRYPAEWIFTLMTAFLGVYLFVLYILRSAEARRLWKSWLLCQFKKKPSLGASSTTGSPTKTRLGVVTSAISSWRKNFQVNILKRAHKDTSDPDRYNSTPAGNTATTSANTYSVPSSVGKMADMSSYYDEPTSVFESTTAGGVSLNMVPTKIELVHKEDAADEETITSFKSDSPSEVPVKKDVETESLVETVSFHDNTSLNSFNRFSSENEPSLPTANGEYSVGSKPSEG